jgi:hypothetical protein
MYPMKTLRGAYALVLSLAFATAAFSDPRLWRGEWPDTDFTRTSVQDWSEIMSGGPPKDGIPALDGAGFIPVHSETRLGDTEGVIAVELAGESPRSYPLRYLTWHEIVNDEVGGIPIAVTFCPLCNSALTFDRRIDGRTLSFGVSGKLRNSDMVMYDRETLSWWQQAIGTGIVGEMTGAELTMLPTWLESWGEFKARNPDGLVMDQPPWRRQYGRNPYVGYDSLARPFLYDGELPPHDIPALMRVVRVNDRAWTYQRLRDEGEISEAGITLSWSSGQSSALDNHAIGGGKDVGSVRVRDASGNDLPHDVMFAFAFHAFFPEGTWMLAGN